MNSLYILGLRSEKIDWLKIENEKIKFPPIYKVFSEIFDVSFENRVNLFKYQRLDSSLISTFGKIKTNFSSEFMIVDTYFPPEEIESKYLPRVVDINDEWERGLIDKKLLPIAGTSTNQLLLLGIGEHNADKIYQETRWNGTVIQYAENIFDYFAKIELIPKTSSSLPDLNVLYQNWGEDFWRVREEGDALKIIESKVDELNKLRNEKQNLDFRLRQWASDLKKAGVSEDEISEKTGLDKQTIGWIK